MKSYPYSYQVTNGQMPSMTYGSEGTQPYQQDYLMNVNSNDDKEDHETQEIKSNKIIEQTNEDTSFSARKLVN